MQAIGKKEKPEMNPSHKSDGRSMRKIVHLWMVVMAALPAGAVQAQTFSKTEAFTYSNNTSKWVLGQLASTTCSASLPVDPSCNGGSGSIESETIYDLKWAVPVQNKAFGRVTQTLDYDTTSTAESGQLGTLRTVKDGNNNITSLIDWKRGVPQLVSFADGTAVSTTVDDNGWPLSAIDEAGAMTCYTYDAMGRVTSVKYPSETASGICDDSRWNITGHIFRPLTASDWMPPGILPGQWVQMTYTGSARKITYLDAMWRPILTNEYDEANAADTLRSVRTVYDSNGRVSFQSFPTSNNVANNIGTRIFYDALDRIVRVEQDSELGVLATTTEYLPGMKTRVTNPRGQRTTTSFMAWDQPTYDLPIRSDQPEDKIIHIIRNPAFGWPTELIQQNSAGTQVAIRRYVYDGSGRLCKMIEPEAGVTVSGYDGVGNPTWMASGLDRQIFGNTTDCQHVDAFNSGRTILRTYDKRNRLVRLKFPDGRGDQVWTYTKDGKPASIVAYNGGGNTSPVITAYKYNNRGLLTGESLGLSGLYTWGLGYDYDANGNLRRQSYPTGLTLDYAPNALGRATRIVDQFGTVYASGARYFPNGALKQFTYGNGIVHTMTQNVRQLPERVVSSGGTVDFDYLYDQNANIASIVDYARGPGYDRIMTYDGLDRLLTANSPMFGGSDQTHRFSYDAIDNLKSWKLAGVKDYAKYVYDPSNRLGNIENSAGATIVGFGYDAQGNLQNKNGQMYDFDFGNRLRSATNKEIYQYDGLGRRVMASLPAGKSIYSQYSRGGQLVYQEDERQAKRLKLEYITMAGSLIATRETSDGATSAATKFIHTDALGSPVATTNAAGQVIERKDYEPWGGVIGKPAYNGVGYTGHLMDGATGLTYMQQRYYDESIGRFLSVDPVIAYANQTGEFNRYKYAANNPYKYLDPDGRIEKMRKTPGGSEKDKSGGNIQCGSGEYGCSGREPAPDQIDTEGMTEVETIVVRVQSSKLNKYKDRSVRNPPLSQMTELQAEYYRKEHQRRTLNLFVWIPARSGMQMGAGMWSSPTKGVKRAGKIAKEVLDLTEKIQIPTETEIMQIESGSVGPMTNREKISGTIDIINNTIEGIDFVEALGKTVE